MTLPEWLPLLKMLKKCKITTKNRLLTPVLQAHYFGISNNIFIAIFVQSCNCPFTGSYGSPPLNNYYIYVWLNLFVSFSFHLARGMLNLDDGILPKIKRLMRNRYSYLLRGRRQNSNSQFLLSRRRPENLQFLVFWFSVFRKSIYVTPNFTRCWVKFGLICFFLRNVFARKESNPW